MQLARDEGDRLARLAFLNRLSICCRDGARREPRAGVAASSGSDRGVESVRVRKAAACARCTASRGQRDLAGLASTAGRLSIRRVPGLVPASGPWIACTAICSRRRCAAKRGSRRARQLRRRGFDRVRRCMDGPAGPRRVLYVYRGRGRCPSWRGYLAVVCKRGRFPAATTSCSSRAPSLRSISRWIRARYRLAPPSRGPQIGSPYA